MTAPAATEAGRLADRYVATLGEALRGETEAALVDVPDHTNVGDAAIWLGEVEALNALGVRVRHVSHLHSYDPRALRRRLGDGVVLIHGGGNLGDLWPAHQALRERVLEDFRDRPVVQLPQSVHFRSDETLDRARRAFEGHPRLTVLVRDQRSLDIVRRHFDTPALLCPDGAFCLGAMARRPPERDTMWLLRTDHEASERRVTTSVRDAVDWLDEPPTRLVRVARTLDGAVRDGALGAQVAARVAAWLHLGAARRRLERGRALLSSARVVVSDRLHAHVLCLLLGVPHVLLDDRFGKIRAFVRTWTEGSPLVRLARDGPEAERTAAALLDGT